MKRTIFSIIFILLLTAVIPEAKSESGASTNSNELIQLLLRKNESGRASAKFFKKRKLKKAIRKVARIYRKVKPDRENRKKSRKLQRKARRIINIF